MGIHDFFMKMNMATGGKNPNDALMSALRSLGLQQLRQDGAYSEYGGWFGGRQAGMAVDGSGVTNAANGAYASAAGLAAASAFGLVSSGYTDWATKRNDFAARNAMQGAQMNIRWWVVSPRPAGQAVRISREQGSGHPLGPGLFGAMDPSVWGYVAQPHVLSAVGGAHFSTIDVAGPNLVATWLPPMSEYQRIAASTDAFGRTAWAALTALSVLADALCGRP